MTDTQVTWLTQESHDRLKAELDQLIANRPTIAAEINDRREDGEWWFPTEISATAPEAAAIPQPPVPQRPGRKPQRRTESSALFDDYEASITV